MDTTAHTPAKTLRRAYAAAIVTVLYFTVLLLTSCTERCNGGKPAEDIMPPTAADSTVYDLYVMSLCPFGFTAVTELSELLRAFPRRELNVWFIGRVEGDNLRSMRGEPEVFDETLWLAVNALYPARYREFLYQRGHSRTPTEDLLAEMNFDVEKIRLWAGEYGRAKLREHYTRSVERNISASPTLFINDIRYNGRVGGGVLVREVCAEADPMPQFCKEYPECSEDAQCFMKGKLGTCINPGKSGQERAVCEYRDDAPFALTVLIADSPRDNPEMQVIEWIERMLPGVNVSVVKFSSEEGVQLMAEHNPVSLPFFHFEKAVEGAHNFTLMQERLEAVAAGGYLLKQGQVRANYFPQRPEKPGLIELYVDPVIPSISMIIGAILSDSSLVGRVVLRPIIFGNQRENFNPILTKLRLEEALRWIVLESEYPRSFHLYLQRYASDPGSTYWFTWFRDMNVNESRFVGRINANQDKITSYREDVIPLSAGEPVMIMLNNRTKVAVPHERMLAQILRSML
ncbi:MAG: hypothetical protein LBC70_10755 [Chitinispirillales bacterium]|nr:hypothetical protein [Chitinispirillales bacterium]